MIRLENAADLDSIRDINRAAFGGEDEAVLVDRLRADGLVIASLVAEDAVRLVGHILFTRLDVTGGQGAIPAAALAPMAVIPEVQNQGIGSALVRAGIEVCRAAGMHAIVVLGHPDYYPRFGFSAALARNLTAPFSGPAFMALELVPGAFGEHATVTYPSAFGIPSKPRP
jgi:putative acetyltransferase